MSRLRFVLGEAGNEFRAGLRGPLFPICIIGLAVYLLLLTFNAEYLRGMNAVDVPRNSPHMVFLMLSGQSMWLFFAWAWLFAQVLLRDRAAYQHEVVLAAPVSLRALLFARFVGACGVGCLLSLGTVAGFLLIPLFGPVGLIAPEFIGPVPWFAFVQGTLLFTIPGVLGNGALFLWAAVRTRSTTGPFGVAAGLVLVWMVSMILLREGQTLIGLASMLDPSAFAEVEEQTNLWTPREKTTSPLAYTVPLVVNRLVWLVGPLLFAGLALARVRREQLVLERAPGARDGRPGLRTRAWSRIAGLVRRTAAPDAAPAPARTLPGRPASSSWIRAALHEAGWHLAVSCRGRGLLIALFMLVMACVGGGYVNFVMDAQGPLVPRSGMLQPLLGEFTFLVLVFMVAGFVGTMVRRDERLGFGEMVDATPAPLGSRFVGRLLAVTGLTVGLAAMPALGAWVLVAVFVPEGLNLRDPILFYLGVMGPGYLEMCGITLLLHAVLRHAGTAHAGAIIAAFIVVLNHEVGVVHYPPAQIGVPAEVVFSEFAGWSPWAAPVFAAGAFKLAFVMLAAAVAWFAWRRGTDLRLRYRLRSALARVRGGASVLAATAAVILAASGTVLHERLTEGGYESPVAADADAAAWERRFWDEAAPFSVRGGEIRVAVDPDAVRTTVIWGLRGVRSEGGALHGTLPHAAEITRVTVGGVPAPVATGFDHFAVPLGSCAVAGCDVEIALTIHSPGWPSEGPAFWLHRSGAWLRAADVLPSLGHDPDRLVRAPAHRAANGLHGRPRQLPARALASAAAVAPAGDWTWSVEFPAGGFGTGTAGTTSGPLEFAAGWWQVPPLETRRGPLVALHGPQRIRDAPVVLDDVADMRSCVAGILGAAPAVETVLQAPRDQGGTGLHGRLLWLPENEGWDVAAGGHGHWRRRATIAGALAARLLTDRADLRKEPGADWLLAGVPGWIGLECVRKRDGVEAWRALQERGSDAVIEALGALDAPAESLAEAGDADWVRDYAPLASLGWAVTLGNAKAAGIVREVARGVRAGTPLAEALRRTAGAEAADALLGAPVASDIAVARGEPRLAVEGERWNWVDGGWQPASAPLHVIQRFDREADAPGPRIGPLPQEIEPPGDGFTLLDAWPAFERSLADNVWRAER